MMLAAGENLFTWYQIAGIIVAIPVSIGLVWGIYRVVHHMALVHEAIIGREATPFSEPLPSMKDQFHTINDHLTDQDTRLFTIEKEYHPNGGTSMRDQLNRNEKLTRKMNYKIEEHIAKDFVVWRELTDNLLAISSGQKEAAEKAVQVAAVIRQQLIDEHLHSDLEE